jgi:hypothetical protein
MVADMHRDGWSVRKIAEALGITTQGVYYHLDRLAEDRRRAK